MTAPAITPFSKARIEALSDGVFAIVITFMLATALAARRGRAAAALRPSQVVNT